MKKKSIPILMYHNVVDEISEAAPDWISAELFHQHIQYLSEKGYHSIHPQQLLHPERLPKKPVLITFDDGYEDIYKNAFPVLKKFNTKACFFIISSVLDSGSKPHFNHWDKGNRPKANHLSVETINEMCNCGLVSIGSHSHSHSTFNGLSEVEISNEIYQSKQLIDEKLNLNINCFSYPGGYTGKKEISYKILKQRGFQLAFGAQSDEIENTKSMDIFNLHRINICNENTFDNPQKRKRFDIIINPFGKKITKLFKL